MARKRGPQRSDRAGVGDEDPQPDLPGLFVGDLCWFQNVPAANWLSQFVVSRREGGCRLILQLDHPTRRAG